MIWLPRNTAQVAHGAPTALRPVTATHNRQVNTPSGARSAPTASIVQIKPKQANEKGAQY